MQLIDRDLIPFLARRYALPPTTSFPFQVATLSDTPLLIGLVHETQL